MNILITAGPTREYIDPVRFISNASTGLMGFAIALEAARRAHKVTLISGPVNLSAPCNVKFIPVTSAAQMRRAVDKNIRAADCVIMAAAVSDFRPLMPQKSKIKKSKVQSPKSVVHLKLTETPDILAELGRNKQNKILVGFALETDNLIRNAKKKLKEKNLDIIVANAIGENNPFGEGGKDVVIIERNGAAKRLKNISKREIAKALLNKIESMAT